jgi:succinate dehydrogenase / fumarate reductase, cytochrome b subunit
MMSVATANVQPEAKASRLAVFWQSQIGKKFVMALTGILMFLFLIGHLLGNLQAFQGAEKFNAYATFLQNAKGLVWTTRLVMLTALVLHATAGIQLYLQSRAARPIRYAEPLAPSTTVASRSMIWTGLLTLSFVVYHLLDLTLGWAVVHAGFLHEQGGQVFAYQNLLGSFRNWGKVIFYGASLVGLGLHLSHGLYSMFQSMGFRQPLWTPGIQRAVVVVAVILAAAYIAIPTGVVVGLIRP